MLDFLVWFVVVNLLGWVSFPISYHILCKLPSRGFMLSKAVGLLLWSFFFWIFVSLGLLQNNLAGQLTAFLIVVGLSIASGWKGKFKELLAWINANKKMIITAELFFMLSFALWAFIRSANPTIIGTEKPMEMAFITSILRSPTFPPNDPWLSGYAISYYYFGYVMIAMLIRITGVTVGVGYNLAASLWFALTALGAYSFLLNILKERWLRRNRDAGDLTPTWLLIAALLAPLMLLIVSNWHGFVDMLHARGLFWTTNSDGIVTSGFWQWLNLNELTSPPYGKPSWLPSRPGGVQWWAASRVIQDFKLSGVSVEVIDEFPFFSYLLSDLHPHVLAMPFVLLIISQALNLYWGGIAGNARIWKWHLPFNWQGTLLAVISLGGLAFLNTWDFPFYLALIAAAFTLERVYRLGWRAKRIWEFILVMAGLGVPSLLLYLPFFLSFASQAGGIFPSLIFYTRGVYFWIMFGPMLIPILVFLIFNWIQNRHERSWRVPLLLTLGLLLLLSMINWGLSLIGSRLKEVSDLFLWLQGGEAVGISGLIRQSLQNRMQDPGTWLTLVIIIFLSLGLLIKTKRAQDPNLVEPNRSANLFEVDPNTHFVLLLVIWGALLALAPEYIYLRDQFSVRMNTIFKFYFQTWILWSLAGSYAIVILWRKMPKFTWTVRLLLGTAGVLGLGVLAIAFCAQNEKITDLSLLPNLIEAPKFGAFLSDWLVVGIGLIFSALLVYALLTKRWTWVMKTFIIAAIGIGLVYPPIALWSKTDGFSPFGGFTLDGSQYFRQIWPDQMEAVDWLSDAPLGVMVEAVSQTGGSYTTYASVSTFSGMPTVLGWVGHEFQWRGGGEEVGSRQADVQTLYSTSSWEDTKRIITMYNIRYIYIGDLERVTYAVNEEKFQAHLETAFSAPNAVIYEIPQEIEP